MNLDPLAFGDGPQRGIASEQDTVVDRFRQCKRKAVIELEPSVLVEVQRGAAHGRSWQLAHFQPFGVQQYSTLLTLAERSNHSFSKSTSGIKNL